MNRNLKSLIGFTLKETNGEIGKVDEFYFDDNSWTIRYLIVKTGSWLFGRKVLISPQAVQTPDWANEVFPVNLTKEQIKNSPDIDTEKPVSKQQEDQLYEYYPWGRDPYEHGAGIFGTMPGELYNTEVPLETTPVTEKTSDKEHNDQHLRSTDKVTGYSIMATDGDIGKVNDYIFDDATWKIKFFIVDAGSWLNSKKVLLSTQMIKEVNWDESTVVVNTSMEAVKNSPPFDNSSSKYDEEEQKQYDYYNPSHKE